MKFGTSINPWFSYFGILLFNINYFISYRFVTVSFILGLIQFIFYFYCLGNLFKNITKLDIEKIEVIIIGFFINSIILFVIASLSFFNPIFFLFTINLIYIANLGLDFVKILPELGSKGYITHLRDSLVAFYNKYLKKVFKSNYSIIFLILFVFHLILLAFAGEIGVDTYRFNYFAYLIIRDGNISSNNGFLAHLQLVPFSSSPMPSLILAFYSISSNISVYYSVLMTSTIFSFLGLFSIYLLVNRILKWNLQKSLFAYFFFLFTPLFLKFTDWSISGRTLIIVFLPYCLFLTEKLFEELNIWIISILVIVLIVLGLSHRGVLIYFYYIFVRTIIFFLNRKGKYILSKKFHRKILPIIIFLIIIPFVLYAFNIKSLIYLWFRDYIPFFKINTDSPALLIFFSCEFLLLIRLSIVFIFSFLFILYPRKQIKKNPLISSSFLIFISFLPFIFRAMYFYQIIYPFLVLLATDLFNELYLFLKNHLNIYSGDLKIMKFFKKNFLVITLFFLMVPGFFVEMYRYDFFNNEEEVIEQYPTDDIKKFAEYIFQKYENETFYVSDPQIALILAALAPMNHYLPNHPQLYTAYELYNTSQKPIFRTELLNGLISKFKIYELIFLPFTYEDVGDYIYFDVLNNLTFDSEQGQELLTYLDINFVITTNQTHIPFFKSLIEKKEYLAIIGDFKIYDVSLTSGMKND